MQRSTGKGARAAVETCVWVGILVACHTPWATATPTPEPIKIVPKAQTRPDLRQNDRKRSMLGLSNAMAILLQSLCRKHYFKVFWYVLLPLQVLIYRYLAAMALIKCLQANLFSNQRNYRTKSGLLCVLLPGLARDRPHSCAGCRFDLTSA
jgi:hypothetical protein